MSSPYTTKQILLHNLILSEHLKNIEEIQEDRAATPDSIKEDLNTTTHTLNLTDEDGKIITRKSPLTPLMCAVIAGNHEAVQILLDKGANVNACDPEDNTALHIAAATGNAQMCELLISAGADVNVQNKKGFTPAHVATGRHNIKAQDILIENGADMSLKTKDGKTPLGIRLATIELMKISFAKVAEVMKLGAARVRDSLRKPWRRESRSPPQKG
ncbi:MAG: ankyrin repeat domain-containing protein [Alphaproteobacteria bacterium]|nr:ankyrin repeat domain-containing protein [Alphaproteobacteria bacterium]